jgi:tetratricopeptide (TPR) repeat protein
MKNTFVLLGFLFSFKLFACLNGETKVLANGTAMYHDFEGAVPRGHTFFKNGLGDLLKELDSLYHSTKKIEFLSDKGYVLVVQGSYHEALDLYLDIEKSHPGRYSTASNLGTIYELLGDNINALKWIKKAVAINPDSHNSSEWLHVKILEAKIDPSKLSNTFDLPVSDLSWNRMEILRSSIFYQLNERMSFIKSNDPIIGLLLFEYGNLLMLERNFIDANETYKQAKEYGYNSELLLKRISFTNGIAYVKGTPGYVTTTRINYEKTILLVLSILLGIVTLYFLFKKAIKNKKPSN